MLFSKNFFFFKSSEILSDLKKNFVEIWSDARSLPTCLATAKLSPPFGANNNDSENVQHPLLDPRAPPPPSPTLFLSLSLGKWGGRDLY